MKKALTIAQLIIVAGIVIFGTVCLYAGNFGGAFATFPFLAFYYVFFVAIKKRRDRQRAEEENEDRE